MSHVKLISYTQPVDDIKELGIDNLQELIAYCARVSNPSNQFNVQTSEKLINFLLDNNHVSPLEMVGACLEINTTRDIARQILRHRSFSFQEFSQRYANPVKDLEFEYSDVRLQDVKNRQNSIETDDEELQDDWVRFQKDITSQSISVYNWAIDNGVAKELARKVLPEGLTMSRMYMQGSIRSWIYYLAVRLDPSTQKEHREIAHLCMKELEKVCPIISKGFE